MEKLLVAAAAAVTTAAAAFYANSEYQRNQLGKELWARATDQPSESAVRPN